MQTNLFTTLIMHFKIVSKPHLYANIEQLFKFPQNKRLFSRVQSQLNGGKLHVAKVFQGETSDVKTNVGKG